MPFHAFPAGRAGYAEPVVRPELPSPTGVFRLLTLVAAIAGSSLITAPADGTPVTSAPLAAVYHR